MRKRMNKYLLTVTEIKFLAFFINLIQKKPFSLLQPIFQFFLGSTVCKCKKSFNIYVGERKLVDRMTQRIGQSNRSKSWNEYKLPRCIGTRECQLSCLEKKKESGNKIATSVLLLLFGYVWSRFVLKKS